MPRKTIALFLVLCLYFTTILQNDKILAKANSKLKVPDDYPTIQEAINNASPGDIILVRNGVYYENIVVKKDIALIGEDRENTIIDGSGAGNIISVLASNVTISNFTLKNSSSTGYGIYIGYFGNIIKDNIIISNNIGIHLAYSSGNQICGNTLSANTIGIQLFYSSANDIRGNAILNNIVGIDIYYYSLDNTIYENTLNQNGHGLRISLYSNNNVFYHNNFIANSHDVYAEQTTNIWCYGEKGNYWDKYEGRDSDKDGVGDFSYNITGIDKDQYPLMGRFYSFAVTFMGHVYRVAMISNSTITSFAFKNVAEMKGKLIIFNASCDDALAGFSKVVVPKAIMANIHMVLVNEEEVNVTLFDVEDVENYYVYLDYSGYCSVKMVYSELLKLYNQILADYQELVGELYSLNESLYSALEDYNRLKKEFHAMSSSHQYQEQNFKSLLYVVATATALFIMTTVYLSMKAHAKGGQSIKGAAYLR